MWAPYNMILISDAFIISANWTLQLLERETVRRERERHSLMGILESVLLAEHWRDQSERIHRNRYFLEFYTASFPFTKSQMKQINAFFPPFSWKAGKPFGKTVQVSCWDSQRQPVLYPLMLGLCSRFHNEQSKWAQSTGRTQERFDGPIHIYSYDTRPAICGHHQTSFKSRKASCWLIQRGDFCWKGDGVLQMYRGVCVRAWWGLETPSSRFVGYLISIHLLLLWQSAPSITQGRCSLGPQRAK